MAKFERVKFVGQRDENGAPLTYLGGVPARDMDADEWYALDAEVRDDALRLGLYEGASSASKAKPRKAETDAPTTRPVAVEHTAPAEPGERGG